MLSSRRSGLAFVGLSSTTSTSRFQKHSMCPQDLNLNDQRPFSSLVNSHCPPPRERGGSHQFAPERRLTQIFSSTTSARKSQLYSTSLRPSLSDVRPEGVVSRRMSSSMTPSARPLPEFDGTTSRTNTSAHETTIEEIKAKFRRADVSQDGSIDLVVGTIGGSTAAAADTNPSLTATGDPVGVPLQEGVACLRINSPSHKNALTGRMMADLSDILTRLEAWTDGRALIIYGAKGFFCSGGDLNTVRDCLVGEGNEEGGTLMATLMQDNLRRLEALPLLTVSLVRGKAIGGGSEITTATDFRLMTPDAEIGFVHVRMAITPGWGGGSRLVGLLGPARALELMASGRRVTAAEALEMGLSQATLGGGGGGGGGEGSLTIKTDEDALRAATAWLEPLLSGPSSSALRAVKGIVHAAKWLPLSVALGREAHLFASTWGAPDHVAALARNIRHKD